MVICDQSHLAVHAAGKSLNQSAAFVEFSLYFPMTLVWLSNVKVRPMWSIVPSVRLINTSLKQVQLYLNSAAA